MPPLQDPAHLQQAQGKPGSSPPAHKVDPAYPLSQRLSLMAADLELHVLTLDSTIRITFVASSYQRGRAPVQVEPLLVVLLDRRPGSQGEETDLSAHQGIHAALLGGDVQGAGRLI